MNRLREQVTSALLLTNPEEVLRSKMAAAEKLASEGNLPVAAKLLTKLSEQVPNDRGVRDVLEKVRLQLTSTSGTSGTGEASRIKRPVWVRGRSRALTGHHADRPDRSQSRARHDQRFV